MTKTGLAAVAACVGALVYAQDRFDGVAGNISTLYRLSDARHFSISPENPTGAKGKGAMAATGNASNAARDLGQGWK